jgi:hypothetical protein
LRARSGVVPDGLYRLGNTPEIHELFPNKHFVTSD